MKSEEGKNFDKEAAAWDQNPSRVRLANDVADTIIRELKPTGDMEVLDFGCGTGLVTLRLQPFVKTVTGADSSKGMLDNLLGKVGASGLKNVKTQFVDRDKGGRIEGTFHAIVSSMTLHHVRDTADLFGQWYGLLMTGGMVCAADLDTEDGSFHNDNTGVVHFGFERSHLKNLLEQAGFREVRDVTAAVVEKEIEGKGKKTFSVFLMTAKK